MKRDDLLSTLDAWFQPGLFRDVAENGLQVEGRDEVERVVCGVTASQALIDQAVEAQADAIFVHHGIVWGGGMRALKGWLGNRVRTLMQHGISLFAYHLPLDAHAELGNNAGLADALGVEPERAPFGEYKGQSIGFSGRLEEPRSLDAVIATHRENVGEPLCAFGDRAKKIETVALCTGGAPDLLHEAVDGGFDLYVTGEVTEWVMSVADEAGVAFIAGGHHQTERFGARRTADKLQTLGLEASFIDVENPA
jgi:dinuclear metal center YbgI/SA1388 family protein